MSTVGCVFRQNPKESMGYWGFMGLKTDLDMVARREVTSCVRN
jgi:hypothetical protein